MGILKKIKGGALQFVLFIGVVIAILLLTFISLAHSHRFFQTKGGLVIENINAVNDGINHSLRNNSVFNDTVVMNIYPENPKEISVYRSYWGMFEKVSVTSEAYGNKYAKTALIGGWFDKKDCPSLFLRENNRPLVVVGAAVIKGKLQLPERGIKAGSMGGKSFTGVISGPGNISKSSSRLPKLTQSLEQNMNQLIKGNFGEGVQMAEVTYPLRIKHSFEEETRVVYSDGAIELSNSSVIGNVIVYSGYKIVVDRSSNIKDAILIAPEIEIKNNSTGHFQALASDKITVGRSCKLNYPTALVITNDRRIENKEDESGVFIADNTIVKGGIAYLLDHSDDMRPYSPQIRISENALVFGEVYCTENLELLGEVRGSVYTSSFMVQKFGSIYQNHIYGGKLDIRNLHERYVGLLLDKKDKKVMKWLY
ncbi:hypothetical protein OOZ15_10375 [Galbibacter sp. EGI 63066]|uniref:hypothetical protein n=1 Tax=Galbibacter sp. EGI 63066 TaxID=2993559 RepID=UPI002249A21F|nr:hypothetical protein [Galbibacter sp. EGI 63066]MCX2680346.1 hypothetical protein [Galbibacter sp. EGI 63066]